MSPGKLVYLPLALLMISSAGRVSAESRSETLVEIERLIDRGDIITAERELSKLAQVNNRTPKELRIRARLAKDGAVARSFLEAALGAVDSPREKEHLYLALARNAQANHDLVRLKSLLADYQREFPRGELLPEAFKLSVYLAERADDLSSARKINRQLKRSGRRAWDREWAEMNLARYDNDASALKRLSGARGSEFASVALYLLIQRNVAKKRFDDAALNLSIMREAYPSAVGSDDLVDIISNLETGGQDDGQVEKLVGSFYSVQVGVFSVRENAERQRRRFKRYGEPVNVQVKKISGKRYYAVYVGGFTSADMAEAFRSTIERSEKELYSIVLRQR